ncbi:hypothetical protein B0T17DRAFT_617514 [Bombardia bombarda]|uniref:Uncharacterized protein n=1 Tax=Bombardia bombarda TaxID=252184 RepID=A0AA39X1G7_9PEZI|nr:hypothetical protein B0T17DRAFT_617514 [Bombardia bombarda]
MPHPPVRAAVFVLDNCSEYEEDVKRNVNEIFTQQAGAVAQSYFRQGKHDSEEEEVVYSWLIIVGFSKPLMGGLDEAKELQDRLATALNATSGRCEVWTPYLTSGKQLVSLIKFIDVKQKALEGTGTDDDTNEFAGLGEKGGDSFGSFARVREVLGLKSSRI